MPQNNVPCFLLKGVGDFLGLTNLLEEKGLRVCVWDRPGIGFSGYARPENLRSSSADLAGLMESLDSSSNPENGGPFFVVGYEKGGLDVLGAAAADEAGLVSEVLVVDTVTLDFMLRALVQAANMTESQVVNGQPKNMTNLGTIHLQNRRTSRWRRRCLRSCPR